MSPLPEPHHNSKREKIKDKQNYRGKDCTRPFTSDHAEHASEYH